MDSFIICTNSFKKDRTHVVVKVPQDGSNIFLTIKHTIFAIRGDFKKPLNAPGCCFEFAPWGLCRGIEPYTHNLFQCMDNPNKVILRGHDRFNRLISLWRFINYTEIPVRMGADSRITA